MNPNEQTAVTCPDCGNQQYASGCVSSVLCRNCGRIIKIERAADPMLMQFFPQNPPLAPKFIPSQPQPKEHIFCINCGAELLRCKFCPHCGERQPLT